MKKKDNTHNKILGMSWRMSDKVSQIEACHLKRNKGLDLRGGKGVSRIRGDYSLKNIKAKNIRKKYFKR